jgi:hypothetical protein
MIRGVTVRRGALPILSLVLAAVAIYDHHWDLAGAWVRKRPRLVLRISRRKEPRCSV